MEQVIGDAAIDSIVVLDQGFGTGGVVGPEALTEEAKLFVSAGAVGADEEPGAFNDERDREDADQQEGPHDQAAAGEDH